MTLLALRRIMVYYEHSGWHDISYTTEGIYFTYTTEGIYFSYEAKNNSRGVYVDREGQHYISAQGRWTPVPTLEAGQLAVVLLS